MNVSSSFFPNSPKLESVQLTFGGWMIKQTIYIHTTDYLFGNGKEGTIDICNNRVNLKGIVPSEKKTNLKGIHIAWFDLCNVHEIT